MAPIKLHTHFAHFVCQYSILSFPTTQKLFHFLRGEMRKYCICLFFRGSCRDHLYLEQHVLFWSVLTLFHLKPGLPAHLLEVPLQASSSSSKTSHHLNIKPTETVKKIRFASLLFFVNKGFGSIFTFQSSSFCGFWSL